MRMFISVLVLAMVALPASAKSKPAAHKAKAKVSAPSAFTGKLLSYQALIKLPKAQRMKYMKDMMDLLSTMESFNTKYTVAERDRMREFRDQVAQLMQLVAFLPEAKADEFDDEAPAVDLSKIVPAWNGFEWTCGRGALFDYVIRACVALNAAGQTSFSRKDAGEDSPIYCPSGTREVPHYRGGSAACIPEANWALIPAERKSGIAKSGYLSPKYLREKSYDEQRDLILGGNGNSDNSGGGPVAVAPSRPVGPQAVQNNDGEPGGAAPAAPDAPADTVPGGTAPGAVGAGQSSPPEAVKADTCEPAAQACKTLSDADRETAVNRFRATADYQGQNANICVSGGFASKYLTANKKASTCDIKRSIDLGGGKKTEPCKDTEALCNPALFCIGGKNSGGKFEPVTFCVKYKTSGDRANRPITDLCASTYAQKLAGKMPLLDCKVDPKLKGDKKRQAEAKCAAMGKVKAEACDPAYLPADANFKKIWEELIAGAQKLRDVWCGKLDFAALFCRECEVLNDKIYAMNKNATGTGCPEVKATGVPAAPASEPPPAAPAAEPEAVRETPRDDGR